MNAAEVAVRVCRFFAAATTGFLVYKLTDAVLKNTHDVDHLHNHQHGAEAAIENLHARVVVLEETKAKRTMGPEAAAPVG